MRRAAMMVAALLAAVSIASADADQANTRSAEAAGARITVSAAASIRTGQPLQVDFAVDRPAGSSVIVPALKGAMDPWEVRDSRPLPADPAQPDRTIERLTLVTFESGDLKVPALTFKVRSADGAETELRSPELPITVRSLLADGFDPSRIRDVKSAVEIPLESRWPWVLGSALLAAILAMLGWRWWRGRPSTMTPSEPAHTRALRELDDLASRQLPQKGLVLDFYVLLSDTVRRYVEGRFGIRAPEQTTKEFLQAARHHPAIREDHQRMLAAFLRAADMVKFAAQRPGPSECDRGLDAARGFVRESTPAEAEESSG
ncbi:MAG: hypothetical protein EBU70_13370, partial [Actinobacteria bacterium]|nr:hypothetical protein [Actinomycetota bacterium]